MYTHVCLCVYHIYIGMYICVCMYVCMYVCVYRQTFHFLGPKSGYHGNILSIFMRAVIILDLKNNDTSNYGSYYRNNNIPVHN